MAFAVLVLPVLLFASPPPTPTPVTKFAAAVPAVKAAPPKPGGPLAFRTQPFSATGTGRLTATGPFKPVVLTTKPFAATGTGALAPTAPFKPKSLTTPPFTATGTGTL